MIFYFMASFLGSIVFHLGEVADLEVHTFTLTLILN